MLRNNKVLKNASWIIVCRIAQMMLNLVVGILSARYLGPSNYGLINYAASIISFISPVMQLGLSNIMVYELLQKPDDEGEILGTSMWMSCASAVLCILGVVGFTMVMNAGEKETIIVCLLSSFVLLFQAVELVIYWFQAKLASKYTSIVMFCAYVVIASYKIYLLATAKNVYWFAISQTFEQAMVAIGCMTIYRKLGGKRFSFSLIRAKILFSRSHHYILSSLMVSIFAQTDRVMIKLMLGSAETGYYSSAANCVGLSAFVFAAIIDSMRPTIYENKQKSVEQYENSISLLYCVIIYLSLAQSAAMTTLAKPIISILYGDSFIPAVSTLRILVWHTSFSYIGSVRNIWVLAENKQKYLLPINLCGAVANVILNYVMIPVWGINGAAFASLITQAFTNIVVSYLIKPIRHNNRIMVNGLIISKMIRSRG